LKKDLNTIFRAIIACLLWSAAYAAIKPGLLWLSFMAATAFSLWFKLLQRPGVLILFHRGKGTVYPELNAN
jgi:hypothetical protein